VSLKVYSPTGKWIATPAQGRFSGGRHRVACGSGGLAKGVYLYTFKADGIGASGKMVIPPP